MSKLIFLVQVSPDFRFLYDSGEGVRRGTGLSIAFTSREQAWEWASVHPPTDQNPFPETFDFVDDDGKEYFSFSGDDDENWRDNVRGEGVRQFVEKIGLVPPPKWVKGTPPRSLDRTSDGAPNWNMWFRWWEDTAPIMTKSQKVALWRFAIPNPYRIVEVELEP